VGAANPAQPAVTPPGTPPDASAPTAAALHLGPALKRTDAELDDLAKVTAEDVDYGRSLWHRHAPQGYEALLDASPHEPK
jgi:hypothetical protein